MFVQNSSPRKAEEYAIVLDEVKARQTSLDSVQLQRLMLGLAEDTLRAIMAKEAASIKRNAQGFSLSISHQTPYASVISVLSNATIAVAGAILRVIVSLSAVAPADMDASDFFRVSPIYSSVS